MAILSTIELGPEKKHKLPNLIQGTATNRLSDYPNNDQSRITK